MRKLSLQNLYDKLLAAYGKQGWWPMHAADQSGQGASYHPGRYELPLTHKQRFEVMIGAVLTQNTSWKNVQVVIDVLGHEELFTPESLLALPTEVLAEKIRPTGYFNQKAKKLQAVSRFCLDSGHLVRGKAPERADLLAIWGVGPETADSILLYAFKEPSFVIDAYTRRLLLRLGWPEEQSSYTELQSFFMKMLPPDRELYNEYHALIVTHAKEHCRKEPVCLGCPLTGSCLKGKNSD